MKIQNVADASFRKYGKVITGVDCAQLIAEMENTPLPEGEVVYVPSVPALEALPVYAELQNRVYGGMPIQIGYCNGDNHTLNALEYHRDSEINVACTDLILLIGSEQDMDPETFAYDTSKIEAFLVPAGTMIEVYATTLHYAPCNAGGRFRCVVVLPKGTNEPLAVTPEKKGEDALLFAVNKWLVAHPESGLDKDGAFMGLTGENLTV
ncbi:MAG TPA: DUF4867 family protein [Firmicutes bacterium]|nr:DUF4867 family protein [Bacillota bacterium]